MPEVNYSGSAGSSVSRVPEVIPGQQGLGSAGCRKLFRQRMQFVNKGVFHSKF